MNFKKLIFSKTALLIVALLVCIGGYWLWQKNKEMKPSERYRTQALQMGDVTQSVSANGTLNPVVLVNVGTQVSGTVKNLFVDFNDRVQKGQVLVELDPSLFMAQVQQSEANVKNSQASLELAQANLARAKELYAQEYISKQELDQATQQAKSAAASLALTKAQLQKDRTNLNYTIIRSPVSGVVVDRQVDKGQTVAASFQTPTLFKIAQDLRNMQIDSSFAEADIGRIKVGQTVRFSVDAFAERSFEGVVKQIRLNPTTLQNVVTYDVVVSVDNADLLLMPGMTAYVNIIIAKEKNVLLLPNAALRFRPQELTRKNDQKAQGKRERKRENSATVFVLENGKPKPITVELGITDNKFTQVISGELKQGSPVITEESRPDGAQNKKTNPGRLF